MRVSYVERLVLRSVLPLGLGLAAIACGRARSSPPPPTPPAPPAPVLASATSAPSAPSAPSAALPASVADAPAEEVAEPTAADGERLFAAKLPVSRSLLLASAGRRVALWDSEHTFASVAATGFVLQPTAGRGIDDAMTKAERFVGEDDFAHRALFLGRTPVVSATRSLRRGGASSHWRVGTPNARVDVPGRVVDLLALDDGREAWLYEQGLTRRLVVVGKDGRVQALAHPEREGEDVPGLSELGKQTCADVALGSANVTKAAVVATAQECHRKTPMRVVFWKLSDLTRTEERLPGDNIELPKLATHPDGRLAVVGAKGGNLFIARRAADGQWSSSAHPLQNVETQAAVLADDGAVWAHFLGMKDEVVVRDGVEVILRDPSSQPLRVKQLGIDLHAGVVVLAANEGGAYLFVERSVGPVPAPLGPRQRD